MSVMNESGSAKGKKSLLTLQEVLTAVDGIHVLGTGDFYFSQVQTDSRNVTEGTLFVPLIGEKQDGHIYIEQAINKGASVVFICLKNYEKDGSMFTTLSLAHPDVFFIAVENTLTALQKAAAAYVEHFPRLIKIAVTGSSGKTTTKEIMAAILRQKYNTITNEGNLNSETGLPLSVFKIREEHQAGIFEMGMNREHEIEEISAVLKARFAIVTNIGTAHIGLLGSRENIAREKSHVFDWFKGIGTGVIPCDDDFTDFLSEQITGNIVKYGLGASEGITNVRDEGLDGTYFCIDGSEAHLALPGKYNFKNALGAVALAKVLGLSSKEIAEGISSLEPMFGRSQVIKGKYTVVQDCYNANPDSMEKSLDFIASVQGEKKKFCVLGDMLELGDDSEKEHARTGALVNGFISNHSIDACVFVGKEMQAAYRECKENKNTRAFETKDDETLLKVKDTLLSMGLSQGDIVLIKASRGLSLERLTKILLEKEVLS